MTRIRRVLHPSDFSRGSAAAFGEAVELARDNRAELVLAHVFTPPLPITRHGCIPASAYVAVAESARAWACTQLDRLAGAARRRGIRTRTALLEGVPHEAITRAARSNRADLIVLGTHGRTGLARLFVGSVAARVVSTATCPVLTVRSDG